LFNEKTKHLTTKNTRSTPSRCSVAQCRLWNTEESKIAEIARDRERQNYSPQIAQMKRRSEKTKTSPLIDKDDTDPKRQISPLRRGEDQIANQKPKASSQQLAANRLVTITVYRSRLLLITKY
jgi:hypothetical protein